MYTTPMHIASSEHHPLCTPPPVYTSHSYPPPKSDVHSPQCAPAPMYATQCTPVTMYTALMHTDPKVHHPQCVSFLVYTTPTYTTPQVDDHPFLGGRGETTPPQYTSPQYSPPLVYSTTRPRVHQPPIYTIPTVHHPQCSPPTMYTTHNVHHSQCTPLPMYNIHNVLQHTHLTSPKVRIVHGACSIVMNTDMHCQA